MDGYPRFSFWVSITLAKIRFLPIVVAFAKIHLYSGGTVQEIDMTVVSL